MATQSATWGRVELLDRGSELVNEDGSRDELDPDLAAALQAHLGLTVEARHPGTHSSSNAGLRAFLNELLPDLGIASMEDLNGVSLTAILEGILG